MRVLIVEDSTMLIPLLRRVVETSYTSDQCSRIDDALHLIASINYGAIILDLSLEDGDGLELCKTVRAKNNSTPILVLTGHHEEATKVTLLDAGADDYIVKPFSGNELMARLRALLRRSHGESNAMIGNGELRLDPARRSVYRAETQISLRRKEFSVLEFLMRHPNQVISRQQLLDQIWDYSGAITNNTVDVHIKYLRDHIDKPFNKQSIQTVHGIGYRFTDTG